MRRKDVKPVQASVAEGPPAEGPGMRERILTSTIEILMEEGFAGTTTRAIAVHAGIAEGTIYRYFRDKTDLVQTAVRERILGEVIEALQTLLESGGRGTVAENLQRVLTLCYGVFVRLMPLTGPLLSDQAVRDRYRADFEAKNIGPRRALDAVVAYLRAERDLGRVPATLDPEAAASMLLGACYYEAYLEHVHGPDRFPLASGELISRMVRMLI